MCTRPCDVLHFINDLAPLHNEFCSRGEAGPAAGSAAEGGSEEGGGVSEEAGGGGQSSVDSGEDGLLVHPSCLQLIHYEDL